MKNMVRRKERESRGIYKSKKQWCCILVKLSSWCQKKMFGRFKFKEMRSLIGDQDLSKNEFKLKGENVELSLKNIENLRNKLTSNPTELWFKRFGIFPNMLYLMSFRKFLFIYKEMQGCYLWVERLCERL